MTDLPRYASAPGHIRAVAFPHVLVLIDYRTGRVQCLLPKAAAHWHEAAHSGHLTAVPPPLAAHLLRVGALHPTPIPMPWAAPVTAPTPAASWGSAEHPAGLVDTIDPFSMRAATALAATWFIQRAGHKQGAMSRLVSALRTFTASARHPASLTDATDAVLAIRRAAWHAPVRTACLEESAAAVFLLATRGLATVWCHGVAADPVRLHAWIQTVHGETVAEPPSTLAYTPTLTIGACHQRPF